MDDTRIRELTQEVLAKLRESPSHEVADLETRVARLEATVRRLEATHGTAAAPVASTTVVVAQTTSGAPHPSLQSFGPQPVGERCCLEPDKPCVGSGQCRAYGH
jgi:hypothetical protein